MRFQIRFWRQWSNSTFSFSASSPIIFPVKTKAKPVSNWQIPQHSVTSLKNLESVARWPLPWTGSTIWTSPICLRMGPHPQAYGTRPDRAPRSRQRSPCHGFQVFQWGHWMLRNLPVRHWLCLCLHGEDDRRGCRKAERWVWSLPPKANLKSHIYRDYWRSAIERKVFSVGLPKKLFFQ